MSAGVFFTITCACGKRSVSYGSWVPKTYNELKDVPDLDSQNNCISALIVKLALPLYLHEYVFVC